MGRKRKATQQKSAAMRLKRIAISAPIPKCSSRVEEMRDLPTDERNCISYTTNEDYLIIKFTALQSLLGNCSCKTCSRVTLEVELGKNYGFAQDIILRCTYCGFSSVVNSSDKFIANSSSSFEVNRRSVHAFTEIGKGHAAMEVFSSNLNLPCMDSKTFTRHLKHYHNSVMLGLCEQMDYVREKVKNIHWETMNISSSDMLDLAVSYDASWQKRGHTSNYAVGCVIDMLSGFVIDYEVLSKFCHECVSAENDLGKNSAEFNMWYEGHSSYCQKNYVGSSGGMEVEIARRLWSRSMSLGFRYLELVGDGDSKTFTTLQEMRVYGQDVELKKEECINHVGKRMGTALRKLVEDEKKRGVTLGGKKPGSLTDTTIKKITRYYRNSIIRNKGNVSAMKQDIYAILKHCNSTDKLPKHKSCPDGNDSWCFYNRALAEHKKPPLHKSNISTPLRDDIVVKIMPIFQRLAADSLLERCCKGVTQNRNESLHSVIWNRCPKISSTSKVRVNIAVARGIMDFNQGIKISMAQVLQSSLMSPSSSTLEILKRKHARRVRRAKRKASEPMKLYRKKVKLAKINLNQKFKKKTNITYTPGGF